MIWRKAPSAASTDRLLIAAVFLVAVFGLVMLASASSAVSYSLHQDPNYFIKHQLISYVIGLAAFWLLARLDYRYLQKIGWPLFGLSLVLLILVLIPGLAKSDRARSWLNIFGFSVQPSELLKFSFLVYLSALFAAKEAVKEKITPFAVSFGVVALLMLAQPDLGTLIIIALMALAVYYIAGGSWKFIGLAFLGAAVCLTILLSVFSYQRDRLSCFLNPAANTRGACYQINQSLIAVGSGGWFGRGLGASRQKFLYLPEVQNDFIFAIIAEEVGLVAGLILLAFYAVIFLKGYHIAYRAKDEFGRNLSFGIVVWLATQVIINIGGVINFMPMTGVPLPLVSYGGSAVVANLAALGVLVNIGKNQG